jgi:hypothetical protein
MGIARLGVTLVFVSMCEIPFLNFPHTGISHPFPAIYVTEMLLCRTGEQTFYNILLTLENSSVVMPFWTLGNS